MASLGLHCCQQAFSGCGQQASHCRGFPCCGDKAPGRTVFRRCSPFRSWRVEAPGRCGKGLVALSRDGIHVPCLGRWILNHWTTREHSPSPPFQNSRMTFSQPPQLSLFSPSVVSIFYLMDCNLPGFTVLHYLLEFAQIHVH